MNGTPLMTKMENYFIREKVCCLSHSYQTLRPYLRSCRSVARFHYLQWLLCVILFNIYTDHTSTPVQRKQDAGTAGGCPVQAGTAGGCPVQVNRTFCVN